MLDGRYNSVVADEDPSASGGSYRVTKFYLKINVSFIQIILY
jgi:hypothetical protein